MYTTAIAETGYRNLPLSMLDESSTNPRRTFEPTKLVELAHSLTMHGFIQPITVRESLQERNGLVKLLRSEC